MIPPPRALRLPGGAPILAYGRSNGPQLLVLQPLFEEMNRCRALVSALCRGLAERGFGCWLPDLPGTGEDERPLDAASWDDWRGTVAAALALIARETRREPATVAIRGGALLDGDAARRWRLSPAAGASLVRDLARAGLTGEEMGGYSLSSALRTALADAEPVTEGLNRTARLIGDERPADVRFEGSALWRRSEPAADDALAEALVKDITTFFRHPGARRDPEPQATPPVALDPGVRRDDNRRRVTLPLANAWIAATIDGPTDASRGWLFVTGGSQTRVGPNRLYERLAAALAKAGDAVIRYDRRGVGDSTGKDDGYRAQRPEMIAAVAALRAACPTLREIVGFGLCDGATALALDGAVADVHRIVAANPWVIEAGVEPPAATVRAHYRDRLRDPAAWARLLRGGVDLAGLARSLRAGTRLDGLTLAEAFATGVPDGSTIVIAEGDGTARAFASAWDRLSRRPAVETVTIATRSHSFTGAEAQAALAALLTRRR